MGKVITCRIFIVCAVALLSGIGAVYGQKYPERRHIRSGNKAYEAQDYGLGIGKYKTAIDINPDSYEAKFNMADALYKSGDYAAAADTLSSLLKHPYLTPEQAAKTHYNLGNAQFQQQKLQEALESYKMSLRQNPFDMEAKYNLAYVQELLKNQQDPNDKNKDDQSDKREDNGQDENRDDQEGDQEKDPNDNDKDDRSDNQEDNGQDENRDDQKGDQDKDPNETPDDRGEQPQDALIAKDDAEQMLQAIQDQEDKTREKMDGKRRATVSKSGKNW